MPERRVEIAPAADRELEQLLAYSANRWGIKQALTYIDQIHGAFRLFCSFPNLGSPSFELAPDARRTVVGEHVVYYRVLPDRIRIMRVVHARQDPGQMQDDGLDDEIAPPD
jgi:toxin ParE1/3/4